MARYLGSDEAIAENLTQVLADGGPERVRRTAGEPAETGETLLGPLRDAIGRRVLLTGDERVRVVPRGRRAGRDLRCQVRFRPRDHRAGRLRRNLLHRGL